MKLYLQMDLALNNLQRLIYHKTKPNQIKLGLGVNLKKNIFRQFNLSYDKC